MNMIGVNAVSSERSSGGGSRARSIIPLGHYCLGQYHRQMGVTSGVHVGHLSLQWDVSVQFKHGYIEALVTYRSQERCPSGHHRLGQFTGQTGGDIWHARGPFFRCNGMSSVQFKHDIAEADYR